MSKYGNICIPTERLFCLSVVLLYRTFGKKSIISFPSEQLALDRFLVAKYFQTLKPSSKSMLPTITPDKIDLPPGTLLNFPGTLADYEQILAQLGDRPIPRIRFRGDRILLMSPLPEHGKEIDIITDIVKALLGHQNRDWDSFHPITLRSGKEAGLEPDACFYIANYQAILGKRGLDLSVDPPPDLAIEIDVTSFTCIEDYIPLAIPEVWIYKQGELNIYRWEDNSYLATDKSNIFPDFPVKQTIPQYVNRAWSVGSSVALREFSRLLS